MDNTTMDALDEIYHSLLSDVKQLEKKLEISIESDTKLPTDLEPIDPEKKLLRERVNTLEAQLKLMTERYKTLHSSISKLKNDTYKMRQKMKYKMTIDQSYARSMSTSSIDDALKQAIKSERTKEEAKEIVTVPSGLSDSETIEYLKEQLETTANEKRALSQKLAAAETKVAVHEKFYKGPSSPLLSSMNPTHSASESGTHLEKKGPLLKRGGANGNTWQKRNMQLSFNTDKCIYILTYKGQKGPVKGQVSLPWSTIRVVNDPKMKVGNCFMISPRIMDKKKKNYYFSAASPAEMQEWVKLLEKAAQYIPTVEEILCGQKPFVTAESSKEDKRSRAETSM